MEITPPKGPAAMPEPDAAPGLAPPAGQVAAKPPGLPALVHFEVFQPPRLDLGQEGMTRLPDPSDAGRPIRNLGAELPGHFDIGPALHHPPHPPEPPPPPPEDLVSKFRLPREGLAAFSPEIGGTEPGPSGNPERPDIRHGLGPGHITSPVPGPANPVGPDGFEAPGLPRPPDPRASAPTGPPPAGPAKPEPQPDPPDPPDSLSFSRLAASLNRDQIARHQDGADLRAAAGLALADLGAASQDETARGVQDPGPPTNPPDPPPR